MAHIYDQVYFGDKIVPLRDAQLSVASSAVLYGLSVYTVFPIFPMQNGALAKADTDCAFAAFCLIDHYNRLINSARIIGIDTFEEKFTYDRFVEAVSKVVYSNDIKEKAFVRATIHVSELIPGTRSRGLATTLSLFVYEAKSIIPQDGARVKTSVWRRTPDFCIPSRAKVNGAYVNSVLGKQDAIDSGYDDCVFLDSNGHVCELSAANIFIVRDGVLITPHVSNDILEGINRRVIIELALEAGIRVEEREIDLTELYIADEVFACGTSSFLAPIVEIDARKIGHRPLAKKKIKNEIPNGKPQDFEASEISIVSKSITERLQEKYASLFDGTFNSYLSILPKMDK